MLKRERRQLEAELTRELAATGKTPPLMSIMQQPSLVESASSAASASDAGPDHGFSLMFETIETEGSRRDSSAAMAACIAAVESLAPVASAPKSAGTIGEPADDVSTPWPLADTHAAGAGQAAWSAADAPVTRSFTASRKRKRTGKAPATAATTAIFEQAPTGKKPYACSMCPKRFANKSNVAPHERTHTGAKPYACSLCPRRFSVKSAVVRHERTHTGEKPYACSLCPRRFTNKSAVVPHERTHTGEKPYACSMCPMRFS